MRNHGELSRESHQTRPIPCLHPTSRLAPATKPRLMGTTPSVSGIWRRYGSRDNRKGRHAVVISPQDAARHGVSHPRRTDALGEILRGIWTMAARYPVFDVSYDVAVIFTLGSVVWVINGFFAWLPAQWPSTEFGGEVGAGTGVTAFLGATIFEVGSVLLMLEAVNEKRTDCFGWAIEEAMESHGLSIRPDPGGCAHHHSVRCGLLTMASGAGTEAGEIGTGREDRRWEWWPAWSELETHYARDIGFLASLSQFLGASVFWISGLTALPSIHDRLSAPVANGVYWLPQVRMYDMHRGLKSFDYTL
ncbi:putative integral membrane protein [Rosellinia necatrix]|uniref:Putative integral membrane protein n=1 Tax=Rosellinia necatrix TaxID=77044 RepID=A0A1S8A6D7_ROSNE|nr:putative integral membrane protein [Rosellinia necatrix]